MNREKAVVAMSGGVDSAVAAYLAQRSGFDVTAVYFKMLPECQQDDVLHRCCRMLGITLEEVDCTEKFHSRVLEPSAKEYISGRTPNPCCLCNKVLKFSELLAFADKLNIKKVFTGHYVRLENICGIRKLHKGVDGTKDQSYFLYQLTQDELSRTVFPLGNLSKSEVRTIAADAGLPCAVRKDSQDACFQVSGECCSETLRRLCGLPVRRGKFMHNGKCVGIHEGLHRYTIGQRQGLNVALGVPAYVKKIDVDSGNVELTVDQNELLTERFTIKNISWQSGTAPSESADLKVRVRYRSAGAACSLRFLSDGTAEVYTAEPQRAVTPGQAAVFYEGDTVCGGGIIQDV